MSNHAEKAMNSFTVLVVDDNAINQKVAVKMLERSHLTVHVANNGLEAVETFKKMRYDLILMDIQMPDMDGLDATRTIRALEKDEFHTTIIALTANAMQGDRERCLQAGMDDYLSKPIKQQDIDLMIEKWLLTKRTPESEIVAQSEQPPSAVIDPKRIEQIQEIGGTPLLRELLVLYLDDIKQFPLNVQSALSDNNFRQIYESAHKLKGSSSNIGVASIRQASVSMEQYAKDQDHEKIASQLAAMHEMIERVRRYIVTSYLAQ